MTIAELRKVLDQFSDDQFVHMRVWITPIFDKKDVVVDKTQHGVDGALLITGQIDITDILLKQQ